jgi:hypothetical protein
MWYHGLAYFFGGLFLTNAIPHLVRGLMGMPFQSPFAKPPGEGLSSSRVNVLWGWFNAAMGYLLIWHVGEFDGRNFAHVGIAGLPAIAFSLWIASHFGRFHGGNDPLAAQKGN